MSGFQEDPAISEVPHLQEYDGHNHNPDLGSVISRKSHEYHDLANIDEVQGEAAVVPEYVEHEANVIDWLAKLFRDPLQKVLHYLVSLFPILRWILHYNFKWLYGDLVAGITVGIVLVPQSMSYAKVAGLEPQYGLYSSFVGVFTYAFFATSKDVSIGPVAVMSAEVGKIVADVQAKNGDKYSAPEIATFLSLICGGIAAGIGILRLGFILEFISTPAVMGFMTGSAFNILVGQVPGLMGYKKLVNTRGATYETVIDTLKNLPKTKSDAAFGLVSLFILYFWRWSTEFAQKRWVKWKWVFFYLQQLRSAVVIIVATAISWGIVHPKKVAFKGPSDDFKPPFSTIGNVPRGLRDVGVMTVPQGIIGEIGSKIPAATIILLLEHIAISKSFGRVNDYKINPNQEVIAIGFNNLIGTFFTAYPSTGSFSRSALKAKCGVRTPLAGIFTGGCVLLAIYCLTQTFYYIPSAVLSAIIIHAVSDLIASYKVTWNFWRIAPLDCGIFLVAVIITVFASIEDGIYFAICASAAALLFRIAIPKGQFLGRVKVAEVINPVIKYSDSQSTDSSFSQDIEVQQVLTDNESNKKKKNEVSENDTNALIRSDPNVRFHTKWVPLTKDNINNNLNVIPPPPGVIVFKPLENFAYPNASLQVDRVSDEVKRLTRRGKPYKYTDTGSRPWNDPGPLRWNIPFKKSVLDDKETAVEEDTRPILRIVHFDFSIVTSTDVSSIQALVDLRKALNVYADREVEFHFSGILNPWIRRGLLNAGFGTYEGEGLVSDKSYVNIATSGDLEAGTSSEYFAAVSTETPFFHLEIPDYS